MLLQMIVVETVKSRTAVARKRGRTQKFRWMSFISGSQRFEDDAPSCDWLILRVAVAVHSVKIQGLRSFSGRTNECSISTVK